MPAISSSILFRFSVATVMATLVSGCGSGTSPKAPDANPKPVIARETPAEEKVPDTPAHRLFAELVKATESGDAEKWKELETQVRELGTKAVPALSDGLINKNSLTRELATVFLSQLASDAAPAAERLVKVLDDESIRTQAQAASALSNIEGFEKQAVPALVKLLDNEDKNIRLIAAASIGNTGEAARDVIPQLTNCLKDSDADVREAAANSLGNLKDLAKPSIASLKELLKDEDERVRKAAEQAIDRIDPSATVESPKN